MPRSWPSWRSAPPFGFLLGQSAGGWLAAEWSWRVAFFVFGAPGLLAALIVALTLREPPRGLADGLDPAQPPASLMRVAQYLWSKPSFRHLIIAYALASFTLNAVAQFVLPFYLRGFALPLALVGAVFGIVAFSSNGAGMLLGGFGFDRLSRHDVRWSLWGPAAALALSAPLYVLAFASPDARISMTLVGAANLILVTHVAPTAATVQNLVGPQMRAFSAALLYLAAGLIGGRIGTHRTRDRERLLCCRDVRWSELSCELSGRACRARWPECARSGMPSGFDAGPAGSPHVRAGCAPLGSGSLPAGGTDIEARSV